ncbi:hypothetical protein [Trichothermofontia sp.]
MFSFLRRLSAATSPAIAGLPQGRKPRHGLANCLRGVGLGVLMLGMSGGFWAIATLTATPIAQAYTARQEIFLARQSAEETYDTFLRRAEQAARAAAQRYFDRDLLVTEVAITVVGESQGSTIPILALRASRYQWRNRPDPSRWITHFATAKALLGFADPVTAVPAPANPPPETAPPAAAGPSPSDRCRPPNNPNDPTQTLLADACTLAEQLVGADRFPNLVAGSSSTATTGLAASCQNNLRNLPAFRNASPTPLTVSEVYEVLRGVYLVSPDLTAWVEADTENPAPSGFACVYRHNPDPQQGMSILVARSIPAGWQPTYSMQLRQRQEQQQPQQPSSEI